MVDLYCETRGFKWIIMITLENLCTRTAQSSRGGHSRRVEKTAC